MARSLAPLMLFAAVAVPLLVLSEGCKSPEGDLPVKTWILDIYGDYGYSDRYGNVILYYNAHWTIKANFSCGGNVFDRLAYRSHEIFTVMVDKQVAITRAAFEAIGSWRNARIVTFDDKSDFVLQLVEHAHLLQKNRNLQKLELHIQRGSFDQLKLWPLFAALSGLQQLSIGDNRALTGNELRAFHERQIIPNEFEVNFYDGAFAITYTKRERAQLFHP